MPDPQIVKAFPPNFVELKRNFPCGVETIFAFGDRIYRPNGRMIFPYVLVHEQLHCARQLAMGVEAWWRKYIDESAFRFEEELVAHRAEYRHYCEHAIPLPSQASKSRMLDAIARRLSGPLYGGLISLQRAKDMIQ
jgi:hypothetical protein